MFKEAPSKRSKHVSSGGPFKYKHDAENPSPLHIHRFFGGKTGKTIVKLRPGCFPFSCLFLRAFSPSHIVPEKLPPRLKERKQYLARNHLFYHIVVDIQAFTPPPTKRRFSCRQFLWFSHWFTAPFREFCQMLFRAWGRSSTMPPRWTPSGPNHKGGEKSMGEVVIQFLVKWRLIKVSC